MSDKIELHWPDDENKLRIVRGTVLSADMAANLHSDGSLTLELIYENDLAVVKLTRDEVHQLMLFLAEMI